MKTEYLVMTCVMLCTAPAFAQTDEDKLPDIYLVDSNGVNMATSRLEISELMLKIGSDDARRSLDLTRKWTRNRWMYSFHGDLDKHNKYVSGQWEPHRGAWFNGVEYLFLEQSGGFVPLSDKSASLSYDNVAKSYTMTLGDGTAAVYLESLGQPQAYPGYGGRPEARLDHAVLPTGERIDFTYKTVIVCAPQPPGGPCVNTNYRRLQGYRSSAGLQIKLSYASDTPSSHLDLEEWFRLSGAVAINGAVDHCAPAADSCSGLTQAWPTVSITRSAYGGGAPNNRTFSETYTDPSGVQTGYEYVEKFFSTSGNYGNPEITKITKLAQPETAILLARDPSNTARILSVTRGGQTWTYAYDNHPSSRKTEVDVYNPLSQHTHVESKFGIDGDMGRQEVTDPLNRLTVYGYTPDGFKIDELVHPNGRKTSYGYDARDNLVAVTHYPTAGSGLTPIGSTFSFPSTCSNRFTCNKPTLRTDRRGNSTAYTYDSVHGGVLTQTGPAVGGVQPQKRFTYAARYAWTKDAAGSFVTSAAPIWVLLQESYCRTTGPAPGGGCLGGWADEVHTFYDYGPNSAPNNLFLRGIAIQADGEVQRTCYRYDAIGRRISETKPKGDLGVCP